MNTHSRSKTRQHRCLLSLFVLLTMSLLSRQAFANAMGAGSGILGIVLYGFVVALPLEWILAAALLLGLRRSAKPGFKILPSFAILVSGVLALIGLAALVVGGKVMPSWTRLSWGFTVGLAVSDVFWGVVSQTRPSWTLTRPWRVRLIPVALSVLLPLVATLPAVFVKVTQRGLGAYGERFVTKRFDANASRITHLVFSRNNSKIIGLGSRWPFVWSLEAKKAQRRTFSKDPSSALTPCFVRGGTVWVENRSPGRPYGEKHLLFQRAGASEAKPQVLKVKHAESVICTPDGETAVVGLGTSKAVVLRFPEAKIVRTVSLPGYCRKIAVSADGQFVACKAVRGNKVWVLAAKDGSVVRQFEAPLGKSTVASLALSAHGTYLVLGGKPWTKRRHDVARRFKVWSTSGPVTAKSLLAWESPVAYPGQAVFVAKPGAKEQLLAIWGSDFAIARWEVGTWKLLGEVKSSPDFPPPPPRSTPVSVVAASLDFRELLFISHGTYVEVRDATTGKKVQTIVGLEDARSLAVSKTRKVLIAGGTHQALARFSLPRGERIPDPFAAPLSGFSHALARSRKTGLVAVAWKNGKISILEDDGLRLRAMIYPPPGKIPGRVSVLAFSGDDRHLLTADSKGLVRLWDVSRRRLLDTQTLPPRGTPVGVLALPKDEFLLLFAHGALHLLSIHADRLEPKKTSPTGCVTSASMALSTTKRTIAVSCQDPGSIRLFDLKTYALRAMTVAHNFPKAMAFSPDGTFLLSGTSGGVLHQWSLPGLKKVRTIFSPKLNKRGTIDSLAQVDSIAFSPDGEAFAMSAFYLNHDVYVFKTSSVASWRGLRR